MNTYLIGFDLGSHSTKGVLISEDGISLASRSLEHYTNMPEPGWQEQDPDRWWEEFKEISKTLLSESNVNPDQVKAVGITGFVPGMVMLDKDDRSIRPALMHTDTRAGSQLKYINGILESPISHGFLLPKLMWVMDNEKKNYSRISKILVPHSFIVQRLTGRYSCDTDTATIFGGVYNGSGKEWSWQICTKLGIEKNILPDIYNADSIVGTISQNAAVLTGLAEGTPVIAGTGDTFAALLGCGAVLHGDMMVYLGTSGTQLFIDGELRDFIHGPHFGSGRAEFTGRIISCGDSMQHYREILGFRDWAIPDKEALGINPGSDGLFAFPHLKQKRDTELSEGDRETIFGLERSHTPWHIYRAVMEGIAYNLKTSFLDYESKVKRLILSGGGARSRVFREIIGGILDTTVYFNQSGNGAIGVALLAGYGSSEAGLKEKSLKISDRAVITTPNKDTVLEYKKYYKKYLKLREVIEDLYEEQEIEEDE